MGDIKKTSEARARNEQVHKESEKGSTRRKNRRTGGRKRAEPPHTYAEARRFTFYAGYAMRARAERELELHGPYGPRQPNYTLRSCARPFGRAAALTSCAPALLWAFVKV